MTRFPHCDSRILHAPGECEYCDEVPEWQELRKAWGIAFTGRVPAIAADRCGKVLPGERPAGRVSVCMQAAGHGDDVPHSGQEPWEALPCPADYAVARGERGDYDAWPGNRAALRESPPS